MPFSEKYPVFRKMAEIGDLRKLTREELELYDEDIKNMCDILQNVLYLMKPNSNFLTLCPLWTQKKR